MKIATKLLVTAGVFAALFTVHLWLADSGLRRQRDERSLRHALQTADARTLEELERTRAGLEAVLAEPEPHGSQWPAHLQRGREARKALSEATARAAASPRLGPACEEWRAALHDFSASWIRYESFVPDLDAAAAATYRLRELAPPVRERFRTALTAIERSAARAAAADHVAELAALDRARTANLVAFGLICAAVLAAALHWHRRLIRPLRRMAADAVDINAGRRLDIRHPYHGSDEIAALGLAFNNALESVKSNSFSRSRLENLVAQRTAELARSDASLHRVIEAGGLGFWDWDIAAQRVRLSGCWHELLGYRFDKVEHSFETWEELIHPDDRTAALAALRAHLAGDLPHCEIEHRMIRADGGWQWILTRGLVVDRDATGRATRVAGTHADIHARKSTEEELSRREAQLRQLSDNLPEGALYQFVVHPDGTLTNTYVGEGFKRVLGADSEVLLANCGWLGERLVPEDAAEFLAANSAAIRGQRPFRGAARFRSANGTIKWLSFRAHPRPTSDGNVLWDGIMLDLTAQKDAEAAISRQVDFLAALNATTVDLLNRREKCLLLQTIVERTSRLLDAPHVELALLEGEELVTRAYVGPCPQTLGDRATRQAAPLSWRALDSGAPVIVDDYPAEAGCRSFYVDMGSRAAAVFPILHGERRLGILGLVRHEPGHVFNLDDLQKGQLLAQLVALVLHNSAIYEDAVRVADSRTKDLRDNEWRLREAQRIAHIGHWEYSFIPGNKIERWSDETYRIFGLEPQSIAIDRAEFNRLVHPDDLPAVRRQIEEVWAAPRRVELNYRIVRPDGSIRYIHDEGEPKLDADGRVIGMQGIVQDVTERAHADAALREREQLFRNLVETIDHGYYIANARSAITYVSPAMEALGGFGRGELLGRSSFRHVAEEDRARVMNNYRRWRDDSTIRNIRSEFRVVAKSGRRFWVEQSTHFVRDADGRVVEARNVLRDITERRAAEEALREREERFRSVFDHSPIPIVLSRLPGGEIVAANAAAERAFGYSLAECLGRTTVDLAIWEDTAERAALLRQLGERGSVTGREVRLRNRSGETLRMLFSVSRIRLGDQPYALSSLLDVTAQKRTEDSLRESELRFKRVVENIGDALVVDDAEGKIVFANDRFLEMFQLAREALAGLTLNDLLAPEDRDAACAIRAARLAASDVPTRFEAEAVRADGSRLWLELRIAPVHENGRRIGSQAALRDITERRNAEEESRRLALLARETENGVVITNPFGQVEWVNPGWSEITGYTLDDVRNRSLGPILQGPGTDPATVQTLREVIRARASTEVEILNYRKGGEPYWVRIAIQPTFDGAGRHTGFFGIAREITEKRLEADALAFFSGANGGALQSHYFDHVAAFLARLLGVRYAMICRFSGPPEARVLHPLGQFPAAIIPQDVPVDEAPCGRMEHRPSFVVPADFAAAYPDFKRCGALGAVSYAGVQITSGDRAIGVVSIVDDRPMRHPHRVEALLRLFAPRLGAEIVRRESEARFRTVFTQSPAMITLLTYPDGRIVELNSAAEKGFGFTRAEALGRTSLELNGWVDPRERDRYLQQLLQHGHVSSFETRMRRKGGEEFIALFNGAIVTVDGQRFTLNTIQDITNQRRTEERLRQSQKIESLGTLAGGIAHDFNNILTGVFGFLELSRAELPPDHPAQVWLANVTTASRRARSLVQQILTFSHRNEGERALTDVAAIATEALKLLRSSLPAMVRLEEKLSPNTPRVLADGTQLHQVVMNLCTNAWQALPESGGVIRVSVSATTIADDVAAAHPGTPRGPAVRLTVSDNGSGMPPEVLERMFDPFFTTKPAGKGTGLGLAVVHGVVRAHGGSIAVQSAPGAGTTFDILLPAVDTPVSASAPGTPIARGRGQRVLLIDDESAGRTALAAVLEHLGYKVDQFEHPSVALTHFASQPGAYAFVMTDFAMPEMTGTQVTEALRRVRPDVPIALVSGYVDIDRQKSLLDAGVSLLLRKPPTLEELARAAAQLTGADRGDP